MSSVSKSKVVQGELTRFSCLQLLMTVLTSALDDCDARDDGDDYDD